MPVASLRRLVLAALLAALMAAGAYVRIPLPAVPFVLSDLFAVLAGLLLGPTGGGAAALVYLLVGAAGLPVFAGGGGGIAHLQGPTGGYLLGYVPGAAVAGAASSWTGRGVASDVLGALLGWAVIFGCGVPWLRLVTGATWREAVAAGLVPFLIPVAVKLAAAVAVARAARPVLPAAGGQDVSG